MKDANFRFLPVLLVNRFKNTVVVADQRRDIVVLQRADFVPPMIPEIVDHDFEVIEQERPEREIEIDREPISMAQDKSRACRIPMLP